MIRITLSALPRRLTLLSATAADVAVMRLVTSP